MLSRRIPMSVAGAVLLLATALVAQGASLGGPAPGLVEGRSETTYTTGDYRCFYGPGVQIWQDADRNGPSMIRCGWEVTREWDYLGGFVENLGTCGIVCVNTWNDRASSLEVFNVTRLGMQAYFCADSGYHHGNCMVRGDGTVLNVGSTYNDSISAMFIE
jgi:hypothetical protein